MSVPLILSFTPEQFARLKAALRNSGEVEISSTCSPSQVESGIMNTHLVDLSYTYDGKQYVSITVVVRRGFAKIASDAKIYNELTETLHKYEKKIYS